ncbi:MAG: type II toxin-antitoxin system RelE/ParE family toxin [Sulfuriferula multivorans]|uniref:Type II toxin-antitoxin system RelE/ParE family toxin n=1 Tax=Sulfuriferula multivorans TaxID=1559896 RepID=A0A7C9KAA7_9PROT|nr:type II toxin-antitoxin system RelE/ParE family toxin [Sulfuriferula multivorans]
MNVAFHPDAEVEFNEAIEWYEMREIGLGLDFATQVYAAVQRAITFPYAWQAMDSEIRRTLVHRFPYGVLYVAEPDRLLVVAVMHLLRQPEYWRNRKS